MADNVNRSQGNNLLLGLVLGAAVVGVGVLGYFYYERTQRDVVKIDVPGFSGEISKDRDGAGFSGEIGKDKDVDIKVD